MGCYPKKPVFKPCRFLFSYKYVLGKLPRAIDVPGFGLHRLKGSEQQRWSINRIEI
jgi:hypothetical protein